jgi:hypothetical protein
MSSQAVHLVSPASQSHCPRAPTEGAQSSLHFRGGISFRPLRNPQASKARDGCVQALNVPIQTVQKCLIIPFGDCITWILDDLELTPGPLATETAYRSKTAIGGCF